MGMVGRYYRLSVLGACWIVCSILPLSLLVERPQNQTPTIVLHAFGMRIVAISVVCPVLNLVRQKSLILS